MIFLSYDMEIDNATVNFNMNGSNGYIYTTHGGLTIKNRSDVTITNLSVTATDLLSKQLQIRRPLLHRIRYIGRIQLLLQFVTTGKVNLSLFILVQLTIERKNLLKLRGQTEHRKIIRTVMG